MALALVALSVALLQGQTSGRDTRMKWWRDARFGMFIHWGVYSVPAGEWKGQRSKEVGEWIMSWANIPRVEYEKLAADSVAESSAAVRARVLS